MIQVITGLQRDRRSTYITLTCVVAVASVAALGTMLLGAGAGDDDRANR